MILSRRSWCQHGVSTARTGWLYPVPLSVAAFSLIRIPGSFLYRVDTGMGHRHAVKPIHRGIWEEES